MKKIADKNTRFADLDVKPGDTVKVELRISEEDKERTQLFEGVVISLKGTGLSRTMTVRKISYGVGVEKILPLSSPMIKDIEVEKRGQVRRSKLYYLRKKVGKRSLDVGFDENYVSQKEALANMAADEDSAEAESEEKPVDEEKPEDKKAKAEKPAEGSEVEAEKTQSSDKNSEEKESKTDKSQAEDETKEKAEEEVKDENKDKDKDKDKESKDDRDDK